MKVEEWNKKEVLDLFKKYRFNRYIERFSLQGEVEENKAQENLFDVKIITKEEELEELIKKVLENKKMYYHFTTQDVNDVDFIIKKNVKAISIVLEEKIVYYYDFENKIENFIKYFKEIFENEDIEIYGFELSRDYILLKQIGIDLENIAFDAKIAAYLLNPTISKYTLEGLANSYLEIDVKQYLSSKRNKGRKRANKFI